MRQTADVFSDNETASSQGSDRAPSEDNLDPEEIAAVIPVEEDPDLHKKAKQAAKERKAQQPEPPV